MGIATTAYPPERLVAEIGTPACPTVIDVRRASAFEQAETLIPAAVWRDHRQAAEWTRTLPAGHPVVVYCVHGHQVSQAAAALLRASGVDARYLDHGIDGYAAAGGPLLRKSAGAACWITRARPKVDRIACGWFIRRFLDRDARLLFAAADWVNDVAAETGAVPFDVKDAEIGHHDGGCSFDALVIRSGIATPALAALAAIVRAADIADAPPRAEAPGLAAVIGGLAALHRDDHALLDAGMAVYDALHAAQRPEAAR